jgi:hypothetical protein
MKGIYSSDMRYTHLPQVFRLTPERSGMAARLISGCAPVLILAGVMTLRSQAKPGASQANVQISPDAQALLDRAIQALGGQRFLNFNTLTTQGRAFSISDGIAAGFIVYDSSFEFPDKRRLSYGLGKTKPVTLINNGSQGWEIDRYGIIDQTDKQIRVWKLANRYSLENLLRVRVHEPGVLVLTGGQDFVNNTPTAILDIIDSRQIDVKLYLNSQNSLPVQISYRIQDPQDRYWDDYANVYSDYENVQGIQTPMHLVESKNGERVAETFRTEVKYNQSYPPHFFAPGSY